jgi:hypothetical protein
MSTTISGHAAITLAETFGLTLNKYADPTDGARDGLTAEEAREIAREDASLIWLDDADIAEAISLEQIRTLRAEATQAGDDMQLLVCERALETDVWSIDDWTGGGHRLTEVQWAQLATMTDTQARAICARAILAAR